MNNSLILKGNSVILTHSNISNPMTEEWTKVHSSLLLQYLTLNQRKEV